MSLINKMLQDLEKRQGPPADNEPISGEVRYARAVAGPRTGLVVSMLLAAVLAIAAAWMFMQPKTVQLVAAASHPPVVRVAAVPAAPAPAPAPDVPKAPELQADLVVPAVPPPDVHVPKAPEVTPARAPEAFPKAIAVAAPKAAPARATLKIEPFAPARDEGKNGATAPAVIKRPSKPTAEDAVAASTDKSEAKTSVAADGRPQKSVSPQQLSENLYKQAVGLAQQGKANDARGTLRKSLEAGPRNVAARQMLVVMLIEANDIGTAASLLREGLKLLPEQSGFSMTLARLQLETNDAAGALVTLEQGLMSASDDPQYHAFYAVVLQRSGRHEEAVKHYLAALRNDPSMPNWLVGVGISLQAVGKEVDAFEAFQRAKDTGRLPEPLIAFVDQRLGQLKR